MASEEELIRARRAKFEKLEQAGSRAYPNTFRGEEEERKRRSQIANDEQLRAPCPPRRTSRATKHPSACSAA